MQHKPDDKKIVFIGVGGAGIAMFNGLSLPDTCESTCIAIDNNEPELKKSQIKERILVENSDMSPSPNLFEMQRKLQPYLKETDGVIILVGLGGGFGSAFAPEIAKIAKSAGAPAFVLATAPFQFEGSARADIANSASVLLRQNADGLVVISQDRLKTILPPKGSFGGVFSVLDSLVAQLSSLVIAHIQRGAHNKNHLQEILAQLPAERKNVCTIFQKNS